MRIIKTIEWHERGLNNMLSHLQRKRNELTDLNLNVDRLEKSCNFLSEQIKRAKEEGKKSFDSSTYNVKRKVV